jgi:LDH2 family malate/lactate/ureidoglycolate dehydrogenase
MTEGLVGPHTPVNLARAAMAEWGAQVFIALGADRSVATQSIEHLLDAEDAGHPSHGLRMVRSISAEVELGHLDPAASPVVELEAGSVCKIDGRLGIGPPIGRFATDAAIRLARSHGASAVAVRASGHMGRLAPFAEHAAAQGCVLFMCANDGGANQGVVPPGGLEARLSTNPFAFGIPRSQPPHLVVDMATSVSAHGTIAALDEAGQQQPDDALLAGDNGLLLPLGGHKGFALGLVVEALAGALTGAGVVAEVEPQESQGALLFAIDVAALASPDAIRDVDAAITWVRSAPTADGTPIRIPGERRAGGAGSEVTIPAGLWDELAAISVRLGVSVPNPRIA